MSERPRPDYQGGPEVAEAPESEVGQEQVEDLHALLEWEADEIHNGHA